MSPNDKFRMVTVFELLKSFPTIRQDWKKKTLIEKCEYLYGIGDLGYGKAAIPLYRVNQKIIWRSHMITAMIVVLTFFVGYTIAFHLPRREYAKFLPCTCLYCLFVVVSALIQIKKFTL